MDGGYHPICALLPKSVTQATLTERKPLCTKTGLSPSVARLSRRLRTAIFLVEVRCTTPHRNEDLHLGLFPLRSPLLGESLLVSFPPLNNMLKFSG